ncbi:MAG: patatin-like phospholipase family protein [Candidatus Colwellbacteria bacterium]|nr:patatin-like phospholipase family protein [Candidatus Colwellbacteria bacterium]
MATRKKAEAKETKRKKIGLALGGGASKGLAHIGVIRALEEFQIPIDFIAGTSMGSLVGGWYAMERNIDSVETIISDLKRKDNILLTEIVRKNGKPILKDESILNIIDRRFGDFKIEDCEIPFCAVATDVKNGEEVLLKSGKMAPAIKASSAIPIVFDPVKIEDRLLIDGGFINPVPADVVRDMGADIVIAVDVSTHWFDLSSFPAGQIKWRNIYSVFDALISVLDYQISRGILKKADIVVKPSVLGFEWFDFRSAGNIIRAGYTETRKSMGDICSIAGCLSPKRTAMEKFWDFVFDLDQ